MPGTVSGLIASYGYVFLFFLVGLASPLPGETATRSRLQHRYCATSCLNVS